MTIKEFYEPSRNMRDEYQREYRGYKSSNRMAMRESYDSMKRLADHIYDCGFEDGYEKALREHGYNERGDENGEDMEMGRADWRRRY